MSERAQEKNQEVIKHSAAIQISSNITLLQRRAWNVLLANAYNELPTHEKHSIQVANLIRVLDFESKNDAYLKDAIRALVSCQVEWNILRKDGKNQWGVAGLLASAVIENGICEYAYSPHLRERLHNPTMYARISLSLQNRFNSKHAQSLWEICSDYLGSGRDAGESPFIPLEQFRKLMGVPDYLYPEFKMINQKVISPAVAEINKVSDFRVEVDHQRRGRKVTAVKFKIKRLAGLLPGAKNQPDLFPDLKDMPAVVQLLKDAGLASQDAWAVFQKGFGGVEEHVRPAINGADPSEAFTQYVKEKIHLLRQRQAQGKVGNPSGFLLSAIKKNFSNAQAEQQAVVASKKQKRRELEKLKESIETIRRDEEEAMHQLTRSLIAASPDLLDEALAAAREQGDPVLRYCYNERTTPMQNFQKHPGITGVACKYLQQKFPDEFHRAAKPFQRQLEKAQKRMVELEA
jgi:hypothetical protein